MQEKTFSAFLSKFWPYVRKPSKFKVENVEKPIVRLLSNIQHWEIPRHFFMNVAIVKVEKKKGSM